MTPVPSPSLSTELSPPSLAGELLPCITCNRTFLPEALARHQNICQKTAHKKRNVFSSSKQRLQGEDGREWAEGAGGPAPVEARPGVWDARTGLRRSRLALAADDRGRLSPR